MSRQAEQDSETLENIWELAALLTREARGLSTTSEEDARIQELHDVLGVGRADTVDAWSEEEQLRFVVRRIAAVVGLAF